MEGTSNNSGEISRYIRLVFDTDDELVRKLFFMSTIHQITAKNEEENHMRSRAKQRELRRTIGKEEKLDMRNYYGNKDVTPYDSVKRIIRSDRRLLRSMGISELTAEA